MPTTQALPNCQRCGNSGMHESRPNGSLEYFYYLLGVHVAECLACGCRNLVYPPGVQHPSQDLNRRDDLRLEVYLPAIFAGEGGTGEGLVVDLSAGGCKLCTPLALSVGTGLHLQIFLAAEPGPLVIERAVIRWVHEATVGLQFVQLQARARERLNQLLHGLTASHSRLGPLVLPKNSPENVQEA